MIVDNRAGAGGVIGTEFVAKGPADGYQILHGTIGGLAVAMSLQSNRGYDTLRDFVPITQTVTVTNFLVVHPTVPAKSIRELIALAKTRPGKLNYASSGSGTGPHLAGELLKYMAGIDIIHVPYKGSAPGLTAMLSGEVDITFENSLLVMPHIASAKVRPLGVTGTQRSKLLPTLPTIAETLPATTRADGMDLLRQPRRPKMWWQNSTRKWCASCASPTWSRVSRVKAPSPLRARRMNSRRLSAPKSTSGRNWWPPPK